METWKTNLDETKKRYIDWWNHKGIILNMWEHFQEGVKPHADIPAPSPAKDLNQKWFDPQWRAEYLDWYVAHSSLKADILPVANTQLGPGSLAAILGGVFEGGEDTIWIHPDPDFNDEIVFNPEHPNWLLHKELLKACKAKANILPHSDTAEGEHNVPDVLGMWGHASEPHCSAPRERHDESRVFLSVCRGTRSALRSRLGLEHI